MAGQRPSPWTVRLQLDAEDADWLAALLREHFWNCRDRDGRALRLARLIDENNPPGARHSRPSASAC